VGSTEETITPLEVMADLNERSWKSVSPNCQVPGGQIFMAHRLAQRAEKELQATLTEKDPTFRNIDHQIDQYVPKCSGFGKFLTSARYRAKCESLMLQDFNFALGKDVENRLWNAHIRINSRFRKQLSTVRPSAESALGALEAYMFTL